MSSITNAQLNRYIELGCKETKDVTRAECPYYKNCATCSRCVYSQSADKDICIEVRK